MSAKDDYPYLAPAFGAPRALDEIDQLRAVNKALDDLISTLTTHADAMRRAISDWIDLPPGDDNTDYIDCIYWNATDAAKAYDDFVKEC